MRCYYLLHPYVFMGKKPIGPSTRCQTAAGLRNVRLGPSVKVQAEPMQALLQPLIAPAQCQKIPSLPSSIHEAFARVPLGLPRAPGNLSLKHNSRPL